MTEYDKIQNAIKRLLTDLPMLGRFVAILLEPVSDDDDKPSFLNRALALNSNLPFGCDKLANGRQVCHAHIIAAEMRALLLVIRHPLTATATARRPCQRCAPWPSSSRSATAVRWCQWRSRGKRNGIWSCKPHGPWGCGVVLYGFLTAVLPNGNGQDALHTGNAKWEARGGGGAYKQFAENNTHTWSIGCLDSEQHKGLQEPVAASNLQAFVTHDTWGRSR